MTDEKPGRRGLTARLRELLRKLPKIGLKTALLVAGLLALEVVVVVFFKPEQGFVFLIPLNLALLMILYSYALKRP